MFLAPIARWQKNAGKRKNNYDVQPLETLHTKCKKATK